MSYVRGKGFPEIATRNADGTFNAPFRSLGDSSTFEARFGSEKFTVNENISGLGKTVVSVTTRITSELSVQLREWNLANLAMALFGSAVDIASVTVVSGSPELLPSGLIVGDEVNVVNKGKVSSLIVVDSTPTTPVTLTLNTHYSHDGYGRIKILSLTGITGQLKVSYVTGVIKRVPILNISQPDVWLRFWQKNTAVKNADGGFQRRCFEFYQVQFNPTETLALMQDNDAAVLSLSGTVIADSTKPESLTMSQYGNVYLLD